MKKFVFLPHTADIKFRVYGKNLNEIFENSVLAVSNIISRGKKIEALKKKISKIEGKDLQESLYNLIDEIIYLLDAESFIVGKVKISFDEKNKKIKATFYGDSAKKYKGLDHIKAATYSEMYIKKTKKGWEAQAVVDV